MKKDIQKQIQRQINFNYVMKTMKKYNDCYDIFALGGCSSDDLKKVHDMVTEKILNTIEKDDSILTMQDFFGYNIGIFAGICQLEPVVMRALENSEASLQTITDKNTGLYGYNTGMVAAQYNLKDATMLALDNSEASLQQNENGQNIGMIAIKHGLVECAEKAIENDAACFQHDRNDDTICSLLYKFNRKQESKAMMESEQFKNTFTDISEWHEILKDRDGNLLKPYYCPEENVQNNQYKTNSNLNAEQSETDESLSDSSSSDSGMSN